jgi:phage terminase large subunit GpA-like protein
MSLLSQVSVHAFIKENNIKTETGVPLDFVDHPFLFDIYADRSPLICSMKAAQIGFTTYEIIKSAHEAKNDGIDIIYVLPTADDVKQFSGGKTNRIIDNNPVMQEWTKDKDSVEQKKWGNATIYYRGSWTERTALLISAQKLIVDEFDRCKQAIVEQYDSRLQHTLNPRKAFFSNPSLPDFGIDKYWKQSDQKKWHITHECGQTYPMEENCIDYKKEQYLCPQCEGEITVDHIKRG